MSPQETMIKGYNTVKDHALEVAALGSTVLAVMIASPQKANAERTYFPPETVQNYCPEFPTAPCDNGIDPSSLDNADVAWCQASVIGVEGDKYNDGMINKQDTDYTIDSGKVKSTTTVGRFDMGTALAYDFSCASVTKNYVKQRMVQAQPSKNDPKKITYKPLSASKTIQGSKGTTFAQSYQAGAKEIVGTANFKMYKNRKLTKEDIKKHKVCVENTIVSEPLVQKPHFEPLQGTAHDVPGPMATQTRKTYDCVKSSQVAKAKTKKRSKSHR